MKNVKGSKPPSSNKGSRKGTEVEETGDTFLTDMLIKGKLPSKPQLKK